MTESPGGGAVAEPWYDRVTGHGFIRLTCRDCGGEVRFRDCPAGRDRADAMVAAHKPSGCCSERQQKAPGRPA